MLHPIQVALETDAERVGLLGTRTRAGTDRTTRAGCERRVELRLALLAPAYTSTDIVAPFVGLANHDLIAGRLVELHGTRVTTG